MRYSSKVIIIGLLASLVSWNAKAEVSSASVISETITAKVDDPRLISKIELPLNVNCNSDISNDGHLLYTICGSKPKHDPLTPSGQAKLYIYDISDLHNPHKVSESDVGEVMGYNLIVRNGMAFYRIIGGKGVAIVDIRDVLHPKAAAHIDATSQDFSVTDDGKLAIVRPSSEKYTFIDVSNPNSPKEVTLEKDRANQLVKGPMKWKAYDWGQIPGISGTVTIKDIRDGKGLFTDETNPFLLHLYDLATPEQPKLLATFPEIGSSSEVHIIPGTQAVISGGGGGKGIYVLSLSKAANPTFDASRLLQDYAQLEQRYPVCLESDYIKHPDCIDVRFKGITHLVDDGIDQLIDRLPDGITPEQRISMLSNYGYWLYRASHNLPKSTSVLQKVIELSPEQASAWLNLGDVNQAHVPQALTESEKVSLWTEATKDYARYKELSGNEAPDASKLESFNLPEVLSSSKDVCDYVAKAYNQKRQVEISSPKGTATANGKTVNFVVAWAGGSCASDEVKAEECSSITCFKNEELLSGFQFATSGYGEEGILIVPFHGKYYTVSVGPGEVIDPASGPVCKFDLRYTPTLVDNKSPALCEKFSNGKLEHNIAWTPVKEGEIENGGGINLANATPFFDRVAKSSFDGKTEMQIGHFNMSSTGGCGCEHDGLVQVENEKVTDTNSEPNKSLLDYQHKWWRCGGADADLVKEDGMTYVDAWGSKRGGIGSASHVLLQNNNGSFEPVCRIDQVMTVVPVPVSDISSSDPNAVP